MRTHNIIVIGTSAGGLEALKTLLSQFPADFSAAIFIVWHMPPEHPSFLPQVLARVCHLPITAPINSEVIQGGRIYIASPNHHLVIETGQDGSEGNNPIRVRSTLGPKENLFRPSIDVLFRSAARAYGSHVIGVVLTGMLDDGASGLYAIKTCNGLAVVQDPVDALYPTMPISAMKAVTVDYVVPIKAMGNLLVRLSAQGARNEPEGRHLMSEAVDNALDIEVKIALSDNGLEAGVMGLGAPSAFTCPDCHGTLLQWKEGSLVRFRCHTGHAFSLNALLTGVTKSVEDSLWNALRVVEESELLLRHIAQHLRDDGQIEAAQMLQEKERDAKTRGDLIRQAVLSNQILTEETAQEPAGSHNSADNTPG